MSFKVGDRVTVSNNTIWNTDCVGLVGTVLRNGTNVIVEFDDPIKGGHNGLGIGKYGHCWNIFLSELELVEESVKLPKTEGDFPQVYKEETYKLAFGTDIITLTRGEIKQLQRKIGELL